MSTFDTIIRNRKRYFSILMVFLFDIFPYNKVRKYPCNDFRRLEYMTNEMVKREIDEAIVAGERALQSLKSAQEKLNSAGKYGVWDILGGGFFVTMMKHSKLEDAQSHMNDAQYYLKVFQKELKDVNISFLSRIDIEVVLSFADIFWDGLFSDCLVQSKISETKTRVNETIIKVEQILDMLKNK